MIRQGSKEQVARVAVLIGGDALLAAFALAFVVQLRRRVGLAFTRGLLPAANLALDPVTISLFLSTLLIALALSGFYQNRVTPRARPSFVTAMFIRIALVAIASSIVARPLPRTILLAVPIVEIGLLPLWRRALGLVLPIRPRETILLGDAHEVEHAIHSLRIAGDPRVRVSAYSPRLDELDDADVQSVMRDVEEVILVSLHVDPRVRLKLLRIRGARGFLVLASHVDALLASRTRGWIGDQPLVAVEASCGHGVGAAVKRVVDVVASIGVLIAALPLWVLAWIAIRLEDGGPALVQQQRVGLLGQPYGMWKFRSMRGPADGAVDSSSHEERITRAGALLRRYHIDELPQLLNVIAGDMSLVGPRPERPELVTRILAEVPDFDLRSLVRPGIAGLAQVSSEYETHPEVKLRYDLMYICDWSMWRDVQLMLRAVSSSLSGTGR